MDPKLRLAAIELLLLWEGRVTNRRLRELFGLGSVHVSVLIREYRERFPGHMVLDTRQKAFLATGNCRPMLTGGTLSEYLRVIEGAGRAGPVERVETDLTRISHRDFAVVHDACIRGHGILAYYQSLNDPAGRVRTLFPHALVYAGRRWHVRAWCTDRTAFRDFVLGRMRDLKAVDARRPVDPAADVAWQHRVTLRCIPHRELAAAQKDVIRHEYCGGAAALLLRSRAALAPYLLMEAGIASDPRTQLPPAYQLELANRDELAEWLWAPQP